MKKNHFFNVVTAAVFCLCLAAIYFNVVTAHRETTRDITESPHAQLAAETTVAQAATAQSVAAEAVTDKSRNMAKTPEQKISDPDAKPARTVSPRQQERHRNGPRDTAPDKPPSRTDGITSATITPDGRLLAPVYNRLIAPPKEAMFYEKLPDRIVKCRLCPWECTLRPNETGLCNVRQNIDGKLIALSYSRPCSIAMDPIEKKPFFHFIPGHGSFSLATAGCNFRCKFCQNWTISQAKPDEIDAFFIPPEGIVKLARRLNSKSISFTYSEPIVFFEYMIETAKIARREGIKTNVVSAGYINPEPLKYLCKYVDAIKIDLKAFNEKYYREVVGGRLQPVLETLKTIKQEGVHLEIVYLVVPTLNDDPEEIKRMCLWIKENLGDKIPLHFTRFTPRYKMQHYPQTPVSTVENLRKIAIESGLKYVYVGNVPPGNPGESTYCHNCGRTLIRRLSYYITENNIVSEKCKFCGVYIYGIW